MKKIIAISLILVISLSLIACKSTYSDVIEQLEDRDMGGYFYTDAQIISMKDEYAIKQNIDSFANFSSIMENGEELNLYVAELETKEQAEAFCLDFASQWRYSVVTENVVVYGNNSVINDLEL